MAGLFRQHIAAGTPPEAAGFRAQSSVYGLPVPLVYGTARIAGNILWWGDQVATPVKSQPQNSKFVHVDAQVTGYTYTAAVALGLCEGQIAAILNVWTDKTKSAWSAATGAGWSLFTGPSGQAVWSYLSSKHPTQAIPYSGLAYVANSLLSTPNAMLPNLTWEVVGLLPNTLGGVVSDASPKAVLTDFLTNTEYGQGIPTAQLGDWTAFSNYVLAYGLLISPVFNAQTAGRDEWGPILEAVNCAPVWSDGVLKIVPYGDTSKTANGVTYTANTAPVYDLDDTAYVTAPGTPPVTVTRAAVVEAPNAVRVQYEDRTNGNDYAPAVAEAKDESAVALYGLLPAVTYQYPFIKDPSVARTVAQLRLQRLQAIRNTYTFTLDARFALLEPMDLVTLTDSGLGLSKRAVRLTQIEEQTDGTFRCTAEDFPNGSASATVYTSTSGAGYGPAQGTAPGATTVGPIFTPPAALMTAPQEIWIAASGGANWGGADVYYSTDNSIFTPAGRITAPATFGTLTASLAAAGVYPPSDTTNTLAVDVSTSGGTLSSGAAADVGPGGTTLCLSGAEVLAYQTATLTSAGHYNLTTLARGLYGTTPGAGSGAVFVRLDANVFRLAVPNLQNGQQVWLKLCAFNTYGNAKQDPSTVTAVAYTAGAPPRTGIGRPWVSVTGAGEDDSALSVQIDGGAPIGGVQWRYRTNGGAWSAYSTIALPYNVGFTKANRGTTVVNVEVQSLVDGQIARASVSLAARYVGLGRQAGPGGVQNISGILSSNGTAISVAAHSLTVGGLNGTANTIAYNAGSCTGSITAPATTAVNYVYASDPGMSGGAVTYVATQSSVTLASGDGYYYVGKITLQSSGSGTGTGGGGGPAPL